MSLRVFSGVFLSLVLIQSVADAFPFSALKQPRRDPGIVYPYDSAGNWGPTRSHAEVRALYSSLFEKRHGNASGVFSVFPASLKGSNSTGPAMVVHKRVETMYRGALVYGHLFKLLNPIGRLTVQEPGVSGLTGCATRTLSRVSDSSQFRKCRVAANAGFFDPFKFSGTFGQCLGNLVVDGHPVQAPGTQNANFGITKDGYFISGYIPQKMVARPDPNNPQKLVSDFEALVGGVIMLVKDGINFVQVSALLENSSTQTTGSIETFCKITTARTAIGHDKEGNFLLFQVDGQSNTDRGIDLYSLADLLIEFGAINAVNLDGGGSSTSTMDSICINMPTDQCPNESDKFHCERAVSSLICLKDN